MKQTIRLTESQLRQIIMGSVRNVLNEGKVINNKPFSQYKKETDDRLNAMVKRLPPLGKDTEKDYEAFGNEARTFMPRYTDNEVNYKRLLGTRNGQEDFNDLKDGKSAEREEILKTCRFHLMSLPYFLRLSKKDQERLIDEYWEWYYEENSPWVKDIYPDDYY